MPEDAGKLEVEYVVISDAAVRRLEKLQAEMDKVEKAAEKQGMTMELSLKHAGIAMAAFGAIAVGILYNIIKSSSYASIWMDQLKYTTMRLADKLLEMTGLKDDIDDLFKGLENFIDALDKVEKIEDISIVIDVVWKDLSEWWGQLSTTKKIIYGVIGAIIILIGLWAAVSAFGIAAAAWATGIVAIKAAVVGLGLKLAGITAWLLTLPVWAAVAIGAVLGLIVVWILWKTGVLKAIYDLGYRFGLWLQELGAKFGAWLAESMIKVGTWLINLQTKISGGISVLLEYWNDFKTDVGIIFDGIWTYIIDGLTTMKTDFFDIITSIITKVSDLITKILSIPPIRTPFFGGGGEPPVSYGTSISPESMPGGGDWSASGGHVLRSGAQMVHQGEDIVNLSKLMSGARMDKTGMGGKDIVINNTITINSGDLRNPSEIRRAANTISKQMGEELRRISTSI